MVFKQAVVYRPFGRPQGKDRNLLLITFCSDRCRWHFNLPIHLSRKLTTMFRLFVVASAVAGVYFIGGQINTLHAVVFTLAGFAFSWLLLASVGMGYAAFRVTK